MRGGTEPTIVGIFQCPARTEGWDVYGSDGNGLQGKWRMAKRIVINQAQLTSTGLQGSDERHFGTSAGSLKLENGSHKPTKQRGTAKERAVLVQSQDHVDTLQRHYSYTRTGTGGDGGLWGENLMCTGLNADNLCIGDKFEVISIQSREKTGAVLEVSSPRKPCCKTAGQLHGRNSRSKEQEDIKAFCRRTGLGGWFFRVLVPGPIHNGDILRLTAQPHPRWNLNKLCDFMFRETTAPLDSAAGLVFWNGALEDLQELAAMDELADFEWKDTVRKYIKKGHQKVEKEWPAKQASLATWKGQKKPHLAAQCNCNPSWGWSAKTYAQAACVAVATATKRVFDAQSTSYRGGKRQKC